MLVTGKADFTAVMEKHTITIGTLTMVDGKPDIKTAEEVVYTGQVKDSNAVAEKAVLKSHKGGQVMIHKKEERLFTMDAYMFIANATESEVPEYRK